MDDFDVKLSEQIETLDKALEHIASQVIPKISDIANKKKLETMESLTDEEVDIAITVGEFWAITEACGIYKGSMIRYLKNQNV